MELYFLRHGMAGSRREWNGPDDERPLTDAGRRRMEGEAEAIARLGIAVDSIISSPLARALQTAEIVARRLGWEDRLLVDERLGHDFSFGFLSEIVGERLDALGLMLVGHEPGFSLAISELTGGSSLVLKKGGLAYVDLPDVPTGGLGSLEGRGDLVWLVPPKILEG